MAPRPRLKTASYNEAKLTSLRALRKKALDDAALFDRQAMAAQRYLSPEGESHSASPQNGPSPVDSLAAELAQSSIGESFPPSQPHQGREPAAQQNAGPARDEVGSESDRSRLAPHLDTVSPSPTPFPAGTQHSPAAQSVRMADADDIVLQVCRPE